ncbi:rubrerythrin family protein [Sedimentibacter sp. MB31-C6]|uniref:rubrerythrin family protein n=1 Tax=Sedimentibacter sp. MB31-C6 TaxID=3109366 RepID=UPI002DDD92F5|nr:rubrerythrin family protein [Sedimentibacter sp. MB36-C1]WSI03495.1 rubrerythrin family protein [Sedimentibacter sp. MB36-C1]
MAVVDFANSETYRNLQSAFQGELIASAKYQIYGTRARQDGYQQIGNIFDETARNEREHARIWLDQINSGQETTTYENLVEAYNLENYEWTEMYRQYAEKAREEGYEDIANLFEAVGLIERHHDFRFRQLAENIRTNRVFCKNNISVWICIICGNLVWNECAPERCPVCGYPQSYYELNCENY